MVSVMNILIKVQNTVSNMSRFTKILIMMTLDFSTSLLAFIISFIIIEKTIVRMKDDVELFVIFLVFSVIMIALFYLVGAYRDVFRYIGTNSLLRLLGYLTLNSFILFCSIYIILGYGPKRLVVIYMMIYAILLIGSRIFLKLILGVINNTSAKVQRVLIYGAGEAGIQILHMMKNSAEYKPVGFLDDDPSKRRLKVEDVSVYSSVMAPQLVGELKVDLILLALPSVSRSRRKDIVFGLEDCGTSVKTLPHISELLDGDPLISKIQNIDVNELLGREPVEPNPQLFSYCIEDQTVMVTGGAGSIGSELCRQIIRSNPATLIILDISEYALYTIEQEISAIIKEKKLNTKLIPIIASVQSKERLEAVFNSYRIDTIYHAAAYKHVPLVELNVVEGIMNNVFGTLYLAEVAIAHNVKNFTLVSTDKAVRPTNVMGASKRMAELILQALANEKNNTCFSMVRFGNVLGSSGSVVPLFKKQISKGGPLTITDPKMSRYFMTIPEAAQLVIQAGAMAEGGEVYVLDMGAPVRIFDLARQMIQLADLSIRDASNPKGDIEIVISGLRPGEKLYEELLIGEATLETEHKLIMAAKEVYLDWNIFKNILNNVQLACQNLDIQSIDKLLNNAPIGYNHNKYYVDLTCPKNIKPNIEQVKLTS